MPRLDLQTPTGDISLAYCIATPNSPSASSIDESLPTILFVHGIYVGKEIFQAQFCDPRLRQFNLVTLDLRVFGETGGVAGTPYTPTESADDIYRFMNALNLPPCHLLGLALGSNIVLEFATTHPEKVLSMILCSPTSSIEPEELHSGRLEVFEYWSAACKAEPFDDSIIQDVLFGANQLLFNNESTELSTAMVGVNAAAAMRNWTKDNLSECYTVVINWVSDRKKLEDLELTRVQCPVRIIHFSGDLTYPPEASQELLRVLEGAGVKSVDKFEVPGPHYGVMMNPKPVNAFIEDLVLSVTGRESKPIPVPLGQTLPTPFSESLAKMGYSPGQSDDSGSSEEDFF
ncbi:hypothetical protein AX16_002328 [Volvariella volvacea WC 439]|nr:hypothetical protein AX16_002328 [Volvariella volvacea WC 439]